MRFFIIDWNFKKSTFSERQQVIQWVYCGIPTISGNGDAGQTSRWLVFCSSQLDPTSGCSEQQSSFEILEWIQLPAGKKRTNFPALSHSDWNGLIPTSACTCRHCLVHMPRPSKWTQCLHASGSDPIPHPKSGNPWCNDSFHRHLHHHHHHHFHHHHHHRHHRHSHCRNVL